MSILNEGLNIKINQKQELIEFQDNDQTLDDVVGQYEKYFSRMKRVEKLMEEKQQQKNVELTQELEKEFENFFLT